MFAQTFRSLLSTPKLSAGSRIWFCFSLQPTLLSSAYLPPSLFALTSNLDNKHLVDIFAFCLQSNITHTITEKTNVRCHETSDSRNPLNQILLAKLSSQSFCRYFENSANFSSCPQGWVTPWRTNSLPEQGFVKLDNYEAWVRIAQKTERIARDERTHSCSNGLRDYRTRITRQMSTWILKLQKCSFSLYMNVTITQQK